MTAATRCMKPVPACWPTAWTALCEAWRALINEAARIERAQYLQPTPCGRCAQRVDHANGYKNKTVLTRLGEVTFEVPQVRSGGFYPSALERGSRSEQAMNLAMAEMYVQGVSTRKVIEVLQKLVGPELSISSTQVSRCTAQLDTGLQAWRTRPLDETPYVIVDARCARVREAGRVVDCAVLIAIEAQRLLNAALKNWRLSHPQLAAWAEKSLPQGFAVFDLPEGHRVRMRTTNGLERLNKELKRRTHVATLFPNTNSCLRLVSALLAEQDEEWMTAKIYLTMKP